jgi:outer membrane lipoprotein-sorting protein
MRFALVETSRARRVAVGLVGVALLAMLATPALAFRPSASWVLGKVMERARDRSTISLKVDATVSAWDVAGKPVVQGAAERVWLATPDKLRREIDDGNGTTVEVRGGGRRTVTEAGGAPKSSKQGLDVLADIMTGSDLDPWPASQRLLTMIKGLGVNPEVVSYARFDGRVAYVIGAKPWETDKPQVWFDKDLLVPLRVITVSTEGTKTTTLDIRYLGWGSPVGGAWYPAAIELWRGGALIRRSVTEGLERNIALDGVQFVAGG